MKLKLKVPTLFLPERMSWKQNDHVMNPGKHAILYCQWWILHSDTYDGRVDGTDDSRDNDGEVKIQMCYWNNNRMKE